MTRAEAARKLCCQLGTDVAAIAPPGIGRWPPAWAIVDAATVELMIALAAWESTGLEEDRARVRAWYYRVIAAWKDAARRYEREIAR